MLNRLVDTGTIRDEAVPDRERGLRGEAVLDCLLLVLPVVKGVLWYKNRGVVETVFRLLWSLSVKSGLRIIVCTLGELSERTVAPHEFYSISEVTVVSNSKCHFDPSHLYKKGNGATKTRLTGWWRVLASVALVMEPDLFV